MFYRNRLSLTLWDSLPLSSGSRSIRSKIACALVFICSVHGLLLSGVLLSDVRANENEVKLRQYSHYAQRSGKTLKLTLANGKTLAFVDKSNPAGGTGVKYEFVDYIQPIDHFLISYLVSEGGAYVLINRNTGKQLNIDEAPVFSPAFDRFITVSICDAYCPYRLQIWQIKPQPRLEETFEPEQYWASGSAKWRDGKTIEVTKEIADPAASDPSKGKYVYKKEILQIKLLPDGWAVTK